MARCKYGNKLINREDITEELKLIEVSDTEAEEETHISKSTILQQAKDLTPVRHDTYFRFQKDGNINPPPYVIQYDYYTDEIIGYYYNTWDASRRTKINYRTISCQCVNNCKPKTTTKSRTYFLRIS